MMAAAWGRNYLTMCACSKYHEPHLATFGSSYSRLCKSRM